jgi:UDP-N-acetylglucosamine transferase subunit ALG13
LTRRSNVFVTVGSTDFDVLIQAVDALVPALNTQGVMQIGYGQYIPVNLPYFRFAPSLAPYYEQASLVIAHGGLATTMEVLRQGLPLVSVGNPDRYDDHQQDLLSTMAEEGFLVWCRRLDGLEHAIETARTMPLRRYQPPECRIHLVINEFLRAHDRSRPGHQILDRTIGRRCLRERWKKEEDLESSPHQASSG